jgi:hypothetical protein
VEFFAFYEDLTKTHHNMKNLIETLALTILVVAVLFFITPLHPTALLAAGIITAFGIYKVRDEKNSENKAVEVAQSKEAEKITDYDISKQKHYSVSANNEKVDMALPVSPKGGHTSGLSKNWRKFRVALTLLVVVVSLTSVYYYNQSQERNKVDAFVSAFGEYEGTPAITFIQVLTLATLTSEDGLKYLGEATRKSWTPSQRVVAATRGLEVNAKHREQLAGYAPSEKIRALNLAAGAIKDQNLKDMAIRLSKMAREQNDPYERLLNSGIQFISESDAIFYIVVESNGMTLPGANQQFATLFQDINTGLKPLFADASPEFGGIVRNEMSDLYGRFRGEAGIK